MSNSIIISREPSAHAGIQKYGCMYDGNHYYIMYWSNNIDTHFYEIHIGEGNIRDSYIFSKRGDDIISVQNLHHVDGVHQDAIAVPAIPQGQEELTGLIHAFDNSL